MPKYFVWKKNKAKNVGRIDKHIINNLFKNEEISSKSQYQLYYMYL